MSENFHESYHEADVAPPSPRATGLVFAAVAAIAAYLYRDHGAVMPVALGLSGVLAATSLAAPKLLGPLNMAWFRLGLAIGRIVNPVVMGVLFAIVIVPAGLLMQMRHDPLRRRRDPSAATYWSRIARGPGVPADGTDGAMRQQF